MTHSRRLAPLLAVTLTAAVAFPSAARAQGSFTLQQVLTYAFPSELAAASRGSTIAYALNQDGHRNIWVASAPDWRARRITTYDKDDGEELTSVQLTPDGETVVYARGGDHDANWPAEGGLAPNASHSPATPLVRIYTVATDGGAPKMIAEGDQPLLSPDGKRVAFSKGNQIWIVPTDGSSEAKQFFFARGESSDAVWSPDGSKLAFVSSRGDHSFIGVFAGDSTPIRYLAPSTSRDASPTWSPDGAHIAFVRIAGVGGTPETLLELHPFPWAIWAADAATGEGHLVWQSPKTLEGSLPETDGGANLHWAAGDRLVFMSDVDGWPHLYSIGVAGGEPLLLTPGKHMDEFIRLSPDRRFLVYGANAGRDTNDIDRRHIFRVPVDRGEPQAITVGDGVEWTPVVTGDGRSIAFIGAGPKAPPVPMIVDAQGGTPRAVAGDPLPSAFPLADLVVPRKVVFRAPDGTLVHGQLFERAGGSAKKPAVVFVHGGPPRQMLLGWHYMDYYSNAYAVNQYLANHGYVVLSVNYRLGIGYGHAFHHPAHWGPWGESEYQDVKAGGEYLRGLAQVDSARIGIWGGSYGGLLTALALARDSKLFKTGVDLHGVHDWTQDLGIWVDGPLQRPASERADFEQAMKVAWSSSPIASMNTWKSPVLLIQGDDDRNVRFHQTVDLARRLAAHGVRFEELVLPDEIHGFLRHESWLAADGATAAWFDRELKGVPRGKTATSR